MRLSTPRPHCPGRARTLVAALLIVPPLLASPALAQAGKRDRPAKPAATATVALADKVFKLDPVGLSMRLPVGAQAQSTRMNDKAVTQILAPDSTWIMNIQTPVTASPDETVEDASQKTISLLQGSVGVVDPDQKEVVETQAKILHREDSLKVGGQDAARFYISLPRPDGGRLVKGYTIFKAGPKQFVVFELITSEGEFERTRGVYETTVATATFTDTGTLMTERAAWVRSGEAFLDGLGEADYVDAMPRDEQWQRIFRPASSGAPTDAEEIGYRGIKFWRGKRGEIDPTKPKGHWTATDKQDGLLCRVRARVLLEQQILDTSAVFFMTPDRREEAWSIRMAIADKEGAPLGGGNEIATRVGDDLTVQRSETGAATKTIPATVVGEGYMSQFEAYLLPRLVIRKGVQAELGFYSYNPDAGLITFRKDSFVKESKPGGAVWAVKTLLRDDTTPLVGRYRDTGELIRIEYEDGRQCEPVSLDDLMQLWRKKGLPTEKMADR